MTTAQLRASTTFRGKRVSRAHDVVLSAAAKAGIPVLLNSGRRLMPEQLALWLHPPAGTPVVARPWKGAPHIMAGSAAHATDIDTAQRSNVRTAAFYHAHGVPVTFNVTGEPWHSIPLSEKALLAAARRLLAPPDPFAAYPADERRWLHEFDRSKPGRRRRVLVRAMKARRKQLWRAAQESGWHKLKRAERYASLLARTK